MKRISILFLTFVMFIGTSLNVYASTPRSETRSQAIEAGGQLAEVIEIIMTRYLSDEITVDELLEGALRGMTENLDRYSTYLNNAELMQFTGALTGRLRGIGVQLLTLESGRVVVTRVFAGSPAERAGVQTGDIIVSVDGTDVQSADIETIRFLILNPDTDNALVSFDRDGEIITFDIPKEIIYAPTVLVDYLDEMPEAEGFRNIGDFRYIQITSVGLTTGDDLRNAIETMREENVRGIILDLRSNTGGYLDVTLDIANQIVPAGVVLRTVNQAGHTRTHASVLREVPFDSIVVLVNQFTASAAEVIASALQDSGAAVVVGETTFGKGLVQTMYFLQTGGALKLTTEEYFRRNGGTINDIGVTPCYVVERGDGEMDAVLLRGLELLLDR